jgi:DNA-directed RNA polymerase specialized sigma subunit
MARKRSHWGEDDGSPQGGWVSAQEEWDDPTFDAVVEKNEEPPVISLEVLTEKQRFVIECLFGIGRPEISEREVAGYMGISQKNVHMLKERALKKLRGVLDDV